MAKNSSKKNAPKPAETVPAAETAAAETQPQADAPETVITPAATEPAPPAQDAVDPAVSIDPEAAAVLPLDPAVVAMLKEEVKPGDVIVPMHRDTPDPNEGERLVVEQIRDDGLIVASPADDEPGEPEMGDVLDRLVGREPSNGYCQTSPTPHLSGLEAQLGADLFEVLQELGAKGMRDQGGVYGYLLRQVAAAVGRKMD